MKRRASSRRSGLLDRLRVHTIEGFDVRSQVVGLVAHHLKPGMFYKAAQVGDGAFRRLAQKVDLELLARLARADCLGRTGNFDCSAMDWFLQRARALGVEHRPPAPLLQGRHLLALGLSPGPQVGAILKQVYERQLDGEVSTLDEAIEEAKRLATMTATKTHGATKSTKDTKGLGLETCGGPDGRGSSDVTRVVLGRNVAARDHRNGPSVARY